VSSGAEIRTFQGHTGSVNSVAFSPDGRYAISGSKDNTIKLWEVSSGAEIRTFQGHTSSVLSVAFSPDGRYAFSGSLDKTLKMWETGISEPVNQPPQAAFTLSPTQGQAPLTVTLDASASTDPDGEIVTYQWTTNGQPLAEGNPFSYTLTQAGEYHLPITLTVTDNQGLTASLEKNVSIIINNQPPAEPATVEPTTGTGQAIIIAGPMLGEKLFQYSNKFSLRMYRLLKKRQFNDDDIHYMNVQAQDIDLDGFPDTELQDYDLFEPEQQLSQAFAQAAGRLTAGQQFIFYLHGHARQDLARLSNYDLTASHLRDLLATLPAGTQQIIIIDTCYSGSFFDELAGVANRVVISSADDRQQAWQQTVDSFADKFLYLLEHGSHVLESFRMAEALLIVDQPDLFFGQTPWLDDNGDGKYLPNDGTLAANIYLGGRGISQAPPPKITQVHPRSTLAENVSAATLWVKTLPSGSSEKIYKVQAVLINPNFAPSNYQGEDTDFSRLEIELIYNEAKDRYEVDYDGFCMEAGLWKIRYQAQDTDGVWSEIAKGEVQVEGCSRTATVSMLLNQNRYTTSDPLRLDMVINGQAVVDLYVAIIFPAGYFQTIAYPLSFSMVGAAQTYQPNVEITEQKTYQIMNFPMPDGVPLGQYQACGVLVKVSTAPLEPGNWIDVDCAGFEVY
jgi:PKD repeat protein